jgi:hypothetical protein
MLFQWLIIEAPSGETHIDSEVTRPSRDSEQTRSSTWNSDPSSKTETIDHADRDLHDIANKEREHRATR